MKIQRLILFISLACFSTLSFSEEAQKASEMPKPTSEPASKAARNRAHKKVEKKKRELLKKLKNHESPEAIGNAKARVQIERTDANRQDYLNDENGKPIKNEPSE